MDGAVAGHESLVRESAEAAFRAALAELRDVTSAVVLLRDRPEQIADLDELDLLVPRRDLAKALATLRRQGWELIQCGLSAPCKRTLGLLREGRLLRLDIHHELVQDGLVYGDAAWLVDTSREDADGLRQPSPEASLYHLILHVVLGKRCLGDKHRAVIEDLMNGVCDLSAVHRQAERHGLGDVVAEALADPTAVLSDPARVAALRRRSVRALVRARPANLARMALRWWARDWAAPFGVRRGFAIAIIGPDGAGKSTFITEFRRQMEALGLPTREAYMGPWDRSIMPTSRFLNWLGASPRDHIPNTEASVAPSIRIPKLVKGMIRRYLYYLNMPIEMWGRYLALVVPHMLLGRIVVMDRYIQDIEVGYKNQILRNGRLARRCVVALSLRPRLCLLLANDPHTIWSRKREDPPEEIAQAMAAYQSMAAERGIPVMMTTLETRDLVARFITDHWRDFLRWRLDRPFS